MAMDKKYKKPGDIKFDNGCKIEFKGIGEYKRDMVPVSISDTFPYVKDLEELQPYSPIKATQQMLENINSRFDEIILNALYWKGYNFKERLEAEQFIRDNCRRVVNKNVSIFFVKEEPFLKIRNNIEIAYNTSVTDGIQKIECELGNYEFL